MITVEDKIKTFSNYVYEKEIKNSYKLIHEIENKNNEILNNKQKEIDTKCLELKNRMNKKIKSDTQKIISNVNLQTKEKILNLKRELLNDFKQEIINSLANFTQTDAYNDYFYKQLDYSKEYFSLNQKIKIFLVSKDLIKFQDEIKNRYNNIEIFEMDSDNIGGFIIESTTTNERMDFSIKRKVKDWNNEIGLVLYEALEK
jgi:vacuolar-type H+-ATPase subunit E/Vma4